MSENGNGSSNLSQRVPVPLLAAGALVGLVAVAAYVAATRESEDESSGAKSKGGRSGGFGRKIGLMTAITLLENDTTRKLVLAVLKAMARRA